MTRVLERSRAARARLGKEEVLQFGVVVGELKTVEHRSDVEDAIAYFRIGHRSRADHAINLPDCGSGAVCIVRATLACRGRIRAYFTTFIVMKNSDAGLM